MRPETNKSFNSFSFFVSCQILNWNKVMIKILFCYWIFLYFFHRNRKINLFKNKKFLLLKPWLYTWRNLT